MVLQLLDLQVINFYGSILHSDTIEITDYNSMSKFTSDDVNSLFTDPINSHKTFKRQLISSLQFQLFR